MYEYMWWLYPPKNLTYVAPENGPFTPKGSRIVFQPPIFRGKLLVLGRLIQSNPVKLTERLQLALTTKETDERPVLDYRFHGWSTYLHVRYPHE